MSGMPGVDWERAPCETCGATTEQQAERQCRQFQTQDGEAFCAGDRSDDEGFILQPTAASLKLLDDWCTEQMRHEPPL